MPSNFKTRLFLILFFAGMTGVMSFLLVDLAALVALFPVPEGSEATTITPAIKLLSVIQPTVLLAVAVLIGVLLANRVGLSSPFAESVAAGHPAFATLKPQLAPGLLGGVVGGVSILVTAALFRSLLTAEVIARISKFGTFLPLPTRLLYGGITEELLLRWGLMTLFVWAAWRIFQKARNEPGRNSFIGAILLSSFIFGLAHLPVALLLLGQPTAAIVLFVVIANSAFGVIAGYLYWKYGLESAVIAHMLTHVVLATASYVGMYF
ncbi:MAG TPA: CPBP family intramembrane glutamic endopeptidase [Pyrinomonadaceae bacterium]|nr:CPBP family intramembrane glutamic endopeptidase [Pyrinomonadaceae bacterium]